MSNVSSTRSSRRQAWSWEQLQGLVGPEILTAPRLDWARVDERCIRYLVQNVAGSPWMDHLALLSAVFTSYAGLDAATVLSHLRSLHARWRSIFAAYSLETVGQWRPAEHIPRYLGDSVFEDTLYTRQRFLETYGSAVAHLQAYIRSLPCPESDAYWRYELPPVPLELQRQFSRHTELREAAKRRRKEETDALTPQFARIRGEAHLRWNALHRLRLKFQEAVTLVESGREALPLAISYEEWDGLQRLHFVLWDRPSFVLAHADQYCAATVQHARAGVRSFRPDQNHYFLEFKRIEYLRGAIPEPDEFLWFGDLLKNGLLGVAPRHGSPEEVKRKQEYLRSWGYGEGNERARPFDSQVAGLLTWPQAQFMFMNEAQQRAEGVLVPVEPLYAAATFGLAALDLLTTTGARMNELMQVSLTPECLHTLVVEGTQRLVLRMVPKGSDMPAEYFVGPETQRNLEKVARLLQDHYRLKPGEPLPKVCFDPEHDRSHRFPARPYLFQFSGRHLPDQAITACLRFLCHGMLFQTLDGRVVALKAHALRHVFATHAHHVEQVPLDVVGAMLHQKDTGVTGYYAAPTRRQVAAAANTLLDRFATHLGDVQDAVVRSPADLRRQWNEACQKAGTLSRVVGGHCTCHAVCPVSFACTGCAHKVPDPSRRHEVVQQREWALVRLAQAEASRLGPEATKMRALIQRCDAELAEMDLMDAYREDEQHEPELRVDPRPRAASPVATDRVRGKATAHRGSGKGDSGPTGAGEPARND